ncbi:MAG: hypothetical protein V1724_00170 [Chloroflexota bacterium]
MNMTRPAVELAKETKKPSRGTRYTTFPTIACAGIALGSAVRLASPRMRKNGPWGVTSKPTMRWVIFPPSGGVCDNVPYLEFIWVLLPDNGDVPYVYGRLYAAGEYNHGVGAKNHRKQRHGHQQG